MATLGFFIIRQINQENVTQTSCFIDLFGPNLVEVHVENW